jgi:hypothetical protein
MGITCGGSLLKWLILMDSWRILWSFDLGLGRNILLSVLNFWSISLENWRSYCWICPNILDLKKRCSFRSRISWLFFLLHVGLDFVDDWVEAWAAYIIWSHKGERLSNNFDTRLIIEVCIFDLILKRNLEIDKIWIDWCYSFLKLKAFRTHLEYRIF